MAKKNTSATIESKQTELEQILKRFENGEVDLDKGIEELQKAQKIAEEIKSELEEIEFRINEIGK